MRSNCWTTEENFWMYEVSWLNGWSPGRNNSRLSSLLDRLSGSNGWWLFLLKGWMAVSKRLAVRNVFAWEVTYYWQYFFHLCLNWCRVMSKTFFPILSTMKISLLSPCVTKPNLSDYISWWYFLVLLFCFVFLIPRNMFNTSTDYSSWHCFILLLFIFINLKESSIKSSVTRKKNATSQLERIQVLEVIITLDKPEWWLSAIFAVSTRKITASWWWFNFLGCLTGLQTIVTLLLFQLELLN